MTAAARFADDTVVVRRGPLLLTGAAAGAGGALIPAVSLPGLWRLWQFYAMVFGAVAFVQLAALLILLGWPTRRTARNATLAAALSLLLWAATRFLGFFQRLDPWRPADTVAGFTDYVAGALQALSLLALFAVAVRGRRRYRPVADAFAWLFLLPVLIAVLAAGAGGVTAALPGNRTGGIEYCRPGGVPLAMDLTVPPGARAAPVVLALHGGGFVVGNRDAGGLGGKLAGADRARFAEVRDSLVARGIAVAAIDYRLAPAAPWPAPLSDAQCAVRYLRDNAAALGVDPRQVSAWGYGSGARLAALLTESGAVPDAGHPVG